MRIYSSITPLYPISLRKSAFASENKGVEQTRAYWREIDWEKPDDKKIPSGMLLQSDFYEYTPHMDSAILDMGCGHGKTLRQLEHNGYRKLYGVDVNASAIQLAKQLANESLVVPQFIQAKAEELPFSDGSMDCVINQAFWTTLVTDIDRKSVIKEINRVLKPGGILYMEEYGQTPRVDENYQRYQEGLKKGYAMGTWEVKDTQGKVLYLAHHYTKNELFDLLSQHGFEVVSYRNLLCKTRSGKDNDGHLIIAKKL